MKLEQRLRALEAQTPGSPVILHLADGSTRTVPAGGLYLYLVASDFWAGREITRMHHQQLEWVRQSIDANEPGGTRMIELLRALLTSACDNLDPDA